MSCGSPLGDLFYLADTLLYRSYDSSLPLNGRDAVLSLSKGAKAYTGQSRYGERNEGLRVRLYRMYGDGLINEEVFTAFRSLADRGQLRPADLAVHQGRAQRGQESHDDATISNAQRGIRSRLMQLAQARASAAKVLVDLETRLTELDGHMAGKEQAARENIERDEGTARLRLSEKAELARSRDRLSAQAQALRSELTRLDDLHTQLDAKSAELEAAQARSRLNAEMIK